MIRDYFSSHYGGLRHTAVSCFRSSSFPDSRGVLYSQLQPYVFFGQNHYPRSARCFGRVGAVGAECVGLLQPFVSICCFSSDAYTYRPPISSAEPEQQHRRAKPLSVQVCIYIQSLLKSPPWEMDSEKLTALHFF